MNTIPEIKVGQHWQEVDPRFSNMPVREVLHVGAAFSMKKYGGGLVDGVREVMFRSAGNGRTSTARTHTNKGRFRFDGKRGGYQLVKDAA